MSGQGYVLSILRVKTLFGARISLPASSTQIGCCSNIDLRIINKSEVDPGDWEVNLTGGEMKVYVGINTAKDKFNWRAMDVTATFNRGGTSTPGSSYQDNSRHWIHNWIDNTFLIL